MNPNHTAKAGDVIAGKYRVERLLGSGGMGYVVAARHLQLDQLVAMKFLRTDALGSPEATTRFLREAQAVAKLRSEHIAKTYDIGSLETGEPYLVMEYLDGKDLAEITKERPSIGAREACEYVLQACEALAEAHSFGIVHRDIKLANIFVTRGPSGSPVVKVLDFGISKSNQVTYDHEVTNAASLLGSPRFMSPEQMRDPRAVDARTDIWSLGVVLYRIVSGQPPFEADTLGRLIAMVLHERETPLSKVKAGLPAGLEHVVARCLEKSPEARFPSVAALAAALVPFCEDAARARATAARIATVLTLPASGDSDAGLLPSLKAARSTAPPSTGTAAPWASVPGADWGRAERRRTPLNPLFIGAALVAVLALLGLAKSRHDAAARAAAPGMSKAMAPLVETSASQRVTPAPAVSAVADAPAPTPPVAESAAVVPPTRSKRVPATTPRTRPAGPPRGSGRAQ